MKIDPNDLADDIKKYYEKEGITMKMIDVFPGDSNPSYEVLVEHMNKVLRLDIEGKTTPIKYIDGGFNDDRPTINVEEYLKKLL